MKPLDDELRSLFKRREPPEGFAGRVLARLETKPWRSGFTQRASALYRGPVLRWVAVAAAVCVVAVLGVVRNYHQQGKRAQAEQASREAMLALRITRVELDAALERAQHVTVEALIASQKSRKEME